MNLILWGARLIAWDGLLPGLVWSSPALIALVLPNNRGAIEVAAVVIPICAFFVRLGAGCRYIRSNNCSQRVREVQLTLFFLGIFLLVLIDAVLMLSHLVPGNGPFAHPADRKMWLALFSSYLALMMIAMYPGPSRSDSIGDEVLYFVE